MLKFLNRKPEEKMEEEDSGGKVCPNGELLTHTLDVSMEELTN